MCEAGAIFNYAFQLMSMPRVRPDLRLDTINQNELQDAFGEVSRQ
jgi:hypothetical protein